MPTDDRIADRLTGRQPNWWVCRGCGTRFHARTDGGLIVDHVKVCDLVDGARDRRCLVSTGDQPGDVAVRGFLDLPRNTCLPEQLDSHGLSGPDGVAAYQLEYGWLMWVPPDPHVHAVDHPDLPSEAPTIQRCAHALGRDHVLFDADQVGDLPTWDW